MIQMTHKEFDDLSSLVGREVWVVMGHGAHESGIIGIFPTNDEALQCRESYDGDDSWAIICVNKHEIASKQP